MEADFCGYATKSGLTCSDGRTIMPSAFAHQDGVQVPLVWQHGHNDPENVLGHAILEARDDGVYAYGFLNGSPKAQHAATLLEHKDINQLSIWANELMERSKRVMHGAIREVSLVLSGANPGALIDSVTIRHSDGEVEALDDEAIIYTGIELEDVDVAHASDDEDDKESDSDDDDDDDDDDNESVKDVYDSMTDKQKEVLHYMLGEAIASSKDDEDDDDDEEDDEDEVKQDNMKHNDQEGTEMGSNVFDRAKSTDDPTPAHTLTHADVEGIVADATKTGSLRDAVENYALQHGISNIDTLFPEAKALANTPELDKRRTEWVSKVLSGARKSPFTRIKTMSADLTVDEARARGYVTGAMKKEEFFAVKSRVTTPTTIYKKQKLDRDDMLDITDFDVVAWLKAEMRLMLDEELARAVLFGDGRDVSHDDKINEQNIRPIATDHPLYTTTITVDLSTPATPTQIQAVIDTIVENRHQFKGSGTPTLFTTETWISKVLLLKDTTGRRIYRNLDEVATELRVTEIVPVEAMEGEEDLICILVNMSDYNIGADAGGQVSMFDDFDIDYNQHKYLIETRVSGALAKLKSAMVIRSNSANLTARTPTSPGWDPETAVITITNQTGYTYKDASTGETMTAGTYEVPKGQTFFVVAEANSGSYFPTTVGTSWQFMNTNA